MKHKNLSETILSKIHLGGLNFGSQWNVNDLSVLLKKALYNNITNFEVASLYGNRQCI